MISLQNTQKLIILIQNSFSLSQALLADHGIDDNAALKISNMASLPNEFAPPDTNTASKTKIGNEEQQQQRPSQTARGNGYDAEAFLYDEKSWPEYRFKDSDYSNYHSQVESPGEGNNGLMTDNTGARFGQPDNPYWQEEEFADGAMNMKPRFGKPEQSDMKPASVTSQKAQAQKQESHDSTEGSSPNISSKVGKPLVGSFTASNLTKVSDKSAPAAQTTSSDSVSGPSSTAPANASAAHKTPLTNGSKSHDKSNAPVNTSSPAADKTTQDSSPQTAPSKVIEKMLSGMIEGTKGGTTESQGQVQGHVQGQVQGQDHSKTPPTDTQSQSNPKVQADDSTSQGQGQGQGQDQSKTPPTDNQSQSNPKVQADDSTSQGQGQGQGQDQSKASPADTQSQSNPKVQGDGLTETPKSAAGPNNPRSKMEQE